MSSPDRTPPKATGPQSIPLRDLSRPPDSGSDETEELDAPSGHKKRHSRTRSLLTGRRTPNYERLDERDVSPIRGGPSGASYATAGLSVPGGSGTDAPLEDVQAVAGA